MKEGTDEGRNRFAATRTGTVLFWAVPTLFRVLIEALLGVVSMSKFVSLANGRVVHVFWQIVGVVVGMRYRSIEGRL